MVLELNLDADAIEHVCVVWSISSVLMCACSLLHQQQRKLFESWLFKIIKRNLDVRDISKQTPNNSKLQVHKRVGWAIALL
jgi:hypothetical protein